FCSKKSAKFLPDLIAQTDAKDGLIFGTLTVKNPLISELKDYLKILSKALRVCLSAKSLNKFLKGAADSAVLK
ncbi:hypothetical protein CJ307_34550, partial [Klebsiella quasipneumoniae]